MKIHKWILPALLLLPLVIGGIAAISLQSAAGRNPVYSFKFQVDLGTLIFIGGLILSSGAVIGTIIQRWGFRQRENLLNQTHEKLLLDRRRFLRQLDHELKNPLTALRMELAYLAGETRPEEYEKVFDDMSTQVKRLTRLVTDLRKLAQLEELQIQRSPLDIEELLIEVIEAAQDHPHYAERFVRLNLLTHPLPLAPIKGDRGLLWLAFYNLLENALKFTPPGAQIDVRSFEVGSNLMVEIADNGPGISAADLPHIFEELYRGENAHGHPGSGLGLALVRTVVVLHQGQVRVRSQEGQGTIFTIILPIREKNF